MPEKKQLKSWLPQRFTSRRSQATER